MSKRQPPHAPGYQRRDRHRPNDALVFAGANSAYYCFRRAPQCGLCQLLTSNHHPPPINHYNCLLKRPFRVYRTIHDFLPSMSRRVRDVDTWNATTLPAMSDERIFTLTFYAKGMHRQFSGSGETFHDVLESLMDMRVEVKYRRRAHIIFQPPI